MGAYNGIVAARDEASAHSEVLICLLGGFRLIKVGRLVATRPGGKTEGLLYNLALRSEHWMPRDALLEALWPGSDLSTASRSLNTLAYSLHRLLGDAISGEAPVLHANGAYRLNVAAGVAVDIQEFENLYRAAERLMASGQMAEGLRSYESAANLYHGDLCEFEGLHPVIERERLRVLYLSLVARLAEHSFQENDYATCLRHALRLLECEPTREDGHRLVMRCYVRLGERAQALRQFRLCEEILHREFQAAPEPATVSLFDQIRLGPTTV